MAGVRVRNIPKETEEKLLKIHFSKPKHGGGKIKKIYYPLLSNDAVIIFEERKVVDQLIKFKHEIRYKVVEVQPLPEHMVYSTVDAKLDEEASVIVQTAHGLKDDMEYWMEIKITLEPDHQYRFQGNWFQLEWVWQYIDQFIQQQEIIHYKSSKQHLQYAGQPREDDKSKDSQRDSRSEDQTINKPSDRAQEKSRHQNASSNDPLLKDDNEVPSLSYRGDDNNASGDIYRDSERESLSPNNFDIKTTEVRSEQGFRDNTASANNEAMRTFSDDNHGDSVPPDSMQNNAHQIFKNRKSQDENSALREFSDQESTKTPRDTASRDLIEENRQGHAQHVNKTSLQLQPPIPSPSMSSNESPRPGKEGYGKSTRSSVNADDQPLGKSKLGPRLTNIPRHYKEDQLLHTFDIRGLKVTVMYGNLVAEETDVIVNAANGQLSHSGGIAYAIKKARGPDMDDECFKYIIKKGCLKTTEVMHTTGGGGIKAQYIMHAVGPMWLGDHRREKFTLELTQTFINCFQYAEDKLCIKSLALPAISTGVQGAPLDTCVRSFVEAILIFTQQHRADRRLADVRLVNNSAESTCTSILLMQTLLSKDPKMSISEEHPEQTDFSRTYSSKMHSELGASGHHNSAADTKKGSSHSRTRSNSLSRATEARSSSKYKSKYSLDERKYAERSHLVKDVTLSGHSSGRDNDRYHRSRSGSFDYKTKKDSVSDFRSTISGVPSYQTEGSPDGKSPKRLPTADSIAKSVPKVKTSLFSFDTDRFKVKGSSFATKKTDRHMSASSNNNGALTGTYKVYSSTSRTPTDTSEDEERDYDKLSLPTYLHTGSQKVTHSSFEKNPSALSGKQETCAICLDEVKDPKQLPQCKHIFCRPCIQRHFASSKPSCPTCGALYGRVVGDQPEDGRMSYSTDRNNCLPGYETEDGMIIIRYTFPDGVQKYNHPHPGKHYKGLERKAYLPNSVEGREVLRLLKKAFDARLVFTIGDSKTSGRQDVLTWNDIHHKTSIAGGSTKYGYPDPSYLSRVKDELAAKGIVSDK